jgi:hypothetical protein
VAARLGVPVKTVHTRIERALEKLRAELDRAHGGRATWAALLFPFAGAPAPLAPTAPTAPTAAAAGPAVLAPLLAMGTLWKWTGAAAALVLVGSVVVLQRASSPARARTPLASAPTRAELAPPPNVAPERASEPVREPVTAEAAAPTAASVPLATEPAPAPQLAGRVIDVERRGLPGLSVRFEATSYPERAAEVAAEHPPVESGVDGAFSLALPGERGRLLAEGRGYATLFPFGLNGELPPEPPLVVVAPARTYGGTVVDVHGAPLPAVELILRLARARARELVPGSFLSSVPLARLRTDAEGHFLVEGVAFVEGVGLEAHAGNYESLHMALPPEDVLDLVLVLEPIALEGPALAGLVRFADGSPAEDAWVSAGGTSTRARADGAFVLALEPGEEPASVCAAHHGTLPARLELAGLAPDARTSLVLELGAPALEISGTVVDGAGQPIAGAQVWTSGGEVFGMVNRRFGELDFYIPTDVEEVLASTQDDWRDGRESRSDAEGRFRLGGLLERDYAVLAMHPVTQEVAWLPAVRAGDGRVTFVLAGREHAREVGGRVVNLAGEPVEGALVRVYRKRVLPDGSQAFKPAAHDFHAVSDAQGRFRFEALCVEGTHLLLNGETIASPQERALDEEPDLLDVVFHAPAVCHLRVFLADPARADVLMLLDERDEPLSLTFLVGSVTLGSEAVTIENGASDLIQTDESARVLVLSKGGQKERIPIRLLPGQVNELRL